MTQEREIIPFSRSLETIAKITWQQFTNRANELGGKLHRIYDESPVERQEDSRDACKGGYNYGKTVAWIVDFSPNPAALESITSALEAIALWPNAGSMAWEMRRFIKSSSKSGYNNVPDVVEFGELIKKIGDNDPTNGDGFRLDMDFFYWDSGSGVDCESTDEEILQAHCKNIAEVIKGLKRYSFHEVIDIDPIPTEEEVEKREREEKEQYWKDFLADARNFHRSPSFFDILDREEFINRPYNKILAYPVEIAEIAYSGWINYDYENPSDAMSEYYREMPYMVVKRAGNWFPSPLPFNYANNSSDKFEKRLKRTLRQKPWLIDFSSRWQDVLQRSFVGGNYRTNHAGEVELVYKNPKYDPSKNSFHDEYEYRCLEPEEERKFFESIESIQSLADSQPSVKPPKQSWVFSEQTGRPYLFTLADGREFNIWLKHEYGSIFWEGKIAIVAHDSSGQLFQDDKIR